jgi:hypothetical protein
MWLGLVESAFGHNRPDSPVAPPVTDLALSAIDLLQALPVDHT